MSDNSDRVIIIGLIIIFGLLILSSYIRVTASCDVFKNIAIKDVPARCVEELTK